MIENYDYALDVALAQEGGYSNNPNDPGGSTYKGVTQATFNAYRAARGDNNTDVRTATDAEISDIYRTMYWNAVSGDTLPSGLDLAAFDAAINTGPREAAFFLQRALNAVGLKENLIVDGRIGVHTLAAAHAVDVREAIKAYSAARLDFYHRLTTYALFGKGWTNRTETIEQTSLALADHPGGPPPGRETA